MTPEQQLEAHFEAIRRLLKEAQQPKISFAEALKSTAKPQVQSSVQSDK